MASDIPDTYSCPSAMARALATYIDCPHEIRRRVLDNFRNAPDSHTIRRMRERHLRPMAHSEPVKPHDGYYPADAFDALERTNAVFLARLEAERTVSAASRQALATIQDFADRRWNVDILTARLQAEGHGG